MILSCCYSIFKFLRLQPLGLYCEGRKTWTRPLQLKHCITFLSLTLRSWFGLQVTLNISLHSYHVLKFSHVFLSFNTSIYQQNVLQVFRGTLYFARKTVDDRRICSWMNGHAAITIFSCSAQMLDRVNYILPLQSNNHLAVYKSY